MRDGRRRQKSPLLASLATSTYSECVCILGSAAVANKQKLRKQPASASAAQLWGYKLIPRLLFCSFRRKERMRKSARRQGKKCQVGLKNAAEILATKRANKTTWWATRMRRGNKKSLTYLMDLWGEREGKMRNTRRRSSWMPEKELHEKKRRRRRPKIRWRMKDGWMCSIYMWSYRSQTLQISFITHTAVDAICRDRFVTSRAYFQHSSRIHFRGVAAKTLLLFFHHQHAFYDTSSLVLLIRWNIFALK